VAGDLSPLTIEATNGARRAAPPALVAAVALGLGSVDMPVPSIADWEWLNWKFPRAVHAGDTIYARWTLTQKRPPRGGAPTSIVVWRVDVHTSDGALCAEGEVGATVKRGVSAQRHRPEEIAPTAAGTPGSAAASAPAPASTPSSRRRKRRPRSNGAAIETPVVAAPPAAEAKPERATGSSRRRRRRRPSGSAAREEEHEPRAAHVQETATTPSPAPSPEAGHAGPVSGGSQTSGTLSRVIRRLRRT